MSGIEGTTLDPNRELGPYERMAKQILGESLIQIVMSEEQREKRSQQMANLYSIHGWALADIGIAYGFSKEWINRELKRYGHQVLPFNKSPKRRRIAG